MRTHWVFVLLNFMVCMALLLVVLGQYRMLSMIIQKGENLKMEAQRLRNQYENVNLQKETLDKQLNQEINLVEDLQDEVSKHGLELEKEKMDVNTCEEEQKTVIDDFNRIRREQSEAEASIKKESDAWNQEINILKEQLTEFRSICNYVKNNTHALKLCGLKLNAPTSVKTN